MLRSHVEFDNQPIAGNHEFIGPSTGRRVITFFPSSLGNCWVSTDPILGPGQGIALAKGANPITLNVEVHGEAVQRTWYVLYDASLGIISWLAGYV